MQTHRLASVELARALLFALALLLGASISSGCAGDLPEAAQQKMDSYYPPVPDQSLWPDSPAQNQADGAGSWDTYSGSPFGCQQDSDCFGLRCCTTPWGVKLCAASCAD